MTDPRRRGPAAIVAEGYARVLRAPAVLLGAWLVLALTALPFALSLRGAISSDLGTSLASIGAARGVNRDWWEEFTFRHPEWARSFTPAIIGGAVPLANASALLDNRGVAAPAGTALGAYVLAWMFLAGGILDRYARQRRLGAAQFFGACGVFFWRFLRLSVLAGLVYLFLFGALHGWLFDRFYPWVTRDLSVERTAFAWRVLLYVVFLLPLGAAMLLFDYAKVRAVVEDRRSASGAVVAAARFIRRHPLHAVTVFLANVGVYLLVAALYVALAPGARHAGWLGLVLTLIVGQAYLLARLVVKLAFYASATALFQDRLAHAAYTAPPEPVWPDSPAVEGILNGVRGA